MSKHNPALRVLAFVSAGISMVSLSPGVSAQDAQNAPVERIEITGSAIKQIQRETALPVTVIKSDDLVNMGVTNVEEATQLISSNQTINGVAQGVGATTGGAAFANLRGIGDNKTLVLLNGRRVANQAYTGGPNGGSADLSTIPMSAIDRIEILRDGASSLYGTDAVGGVINFILKRDFRGASVAGYYDGPTTNGGGWSRGASATLGYGSIADQRFNAMLVIDDRTQDHLRAVDRPYAATGIRPDLNFVGFSSTPFPANITAPVAGNPSLPGCKPPLSLPDPFGDTTRCIEDFSALIDLAPDVHQQSRTARVNWKVWDDNILSAEYYNAENTATYRVAPTPVTGITMPTTSPFYPGNGIIPAIAGITGSGQPIGLKWRSLPAGQRTTVSDALADRFVLNLDGSWNKWDYRLGVFRSSEATTDSFTDGYVNKSTIQAGLNAGLLNPFGDQTAAGAAALDAAKVLGPVIQAKGVTKGADFRLSSEIFNLPAGPLAFAFGGEARVETLFLDLVIDPKTGQPAAFNAISSGLEGTSTIPQSSRHVDALYTEFDIPIVAHLDADISGRYDRYSDSGSTFNPKISLKFQPIEQVLLRSSFNTGFRAPSLYDIYQPKSITNTAQTWNDPVLCPNGKVNTAQGGVAALDCGQQFNAAQGGPVGAGLSAGSLSPEKSRSFSFGGVWQITKSGSVGIDYWNIRLRDQISTLPEQAIFGNPTTYAANYVRCNTFSLAQVQANAALSSTCLDNNGLLRGQALAYVTETTQNLGEIHTHGLDLQAKWRFQLESYGSLEFNMNGTWTLKYEYQNYKDGPFIQNAGVFADQSPVITWQHDATLAWDFMGFTTTVGNRYKRGYQDQIPFDSAGRWFDTTLRRDVAAYNVWDLFVSYHGIKDVTLTAGAKNILNTEPPASWQGATFQQGYDPRIADPYGRIISVRGEWKFL